VPLLSATLNHQSNVYYTNQDHSNLPTGAALQMAVNLLHGITDPNAVPDNAIRTTPFDYNGRIIGIYSPAQLDVYDDQNNHTGITSDGTAEENIPGSFYKEIGEAKFIYLPDGGHYHLTTKATGTGSFDLKIKNYTNSQLSQANLYLNVEQTASTTGSMNLDTTNPVFTVDVNGDGTNIQQIPPAYTLTGNDVYDIAPPVTTAKLSSSQNTSGNYVDPGTVMLIATPSAGFNIAHTYYKIDNGLQQTYSSPFPVSGAGNHTIMYWSIDNAGLTEIQNTKIFTVASTVIAQDTFHRANQNHWGTASDGQAWTADANTNNSFAINNNAGNVNGGGITYSAILGTSATDAQVLFTGSMSNFTDSNIGAVLRWTDANNWYKAFIDGTNLIIRKKVNGTDTTLATILFTSSANTNYSLRFQVVGATLSAKVWQTGQTEPDDWMITVTDNSFSSGYCGLRMIAQSGKTAAYTSFIATNLSGNPIPTPTLTPAPTPGITIAQDTFHRTDQTKWGTASDGQAWGADANTNNKFSIMNNTGQQTNGNGTTYTGILGTTSTDAQIIFTGSMSNYTNSNLGGVLRFTNGDNWYKVHIDGGNLVIQKKVNGTTTILNSIVFTATAGTNYSLRFQIAGNMLQAKVWQTGQTEPANWMATVTDNTFSSGYCGLRMLTQSGITATYTSFAATSL